MARKNIIKSAVAALALLTGINAYGQATIDNFDYASHRNRIDLDGKCYEGTIFNYNLLSNNTIEQSDKTNVNIEPVWFYDIDNDGKFGKAEIDAIKKGIPIFMNNAFNDIANAKVRKFLEMASEYSSLSSKLNQEKDSSEKQGEYYESILAQNRVRISDLEATIAELSKQIPTSSNNSEVQIEVNSLQTDTIIVSPGLGNNGYIIPSSDKSGSYGILSETPKPQNPDTSNAQKNTVPVEFIFGLNTNPSLDYFSGTAGIRVSPLNNGLVGFSALVNAGIGKDKVLGSANVTYFDPVYNSDVTMSGTKTSTDNFSVGGSVEMNVGPLVIGGGVNYNSNIQNISEQITSGNIVLNSTSNSKLNSSLSENLYGGLEIAITKNNKLGAIVEYDTLNGLSFGLRDIIKLNPSKE
jgi:hypothetical protein